MIKKQIVGIALWACLLLSGCGTSSGSSGSNSRGNDDQVQVVDIATLPQEPAKSLLQSRPSMALPGAHHQLYRYKEPYAVFGFQAGYRISTDIRSGIRSFTQDAQVNALTDEAYGLMIETCQQQKARLGRFTAASNKTLGTLETFFSCILPK